MVQSQTDDKRVTELKCKVRSAGRWWHTVSGFSGSSTASPRLDLLTFVPSVIGGTGTLGAVKDALVAEVYPLLHRVLEDSRHSTAFKNMYDRGTVVVVDYCRRHEQHDPTLRVAMFVILLKSIEPFDLTAAWLECPGSWCDDGMVHYGASVRSGPLTELLTPPLQPWVQQASSSSCTQGHNLAD